MAAPPDLRVLCGRLASTPVDDLPRLCPLLINHALRCGGPLSAPQDAKGRASSETPMLVHKLRTHITSLLNGKSPAGRFAAVCLIKAVIDVGGWESLRAADPWLKGLIGVLQKPDPLASKELCVVALTKIYLLLQGYQTLVREMATPTLPSYVTACLQLIKPPASGKPLRVPATFIESVACSLSKLVICYPTTLRPFAAQMRAALRAYVAPTSSDPAVVPQSLRESSRQLYILLSFTAPKNGGSEEWARGIRSIILDSHATVDQVFRAVVESWESTTGYVSQAARHGADPSGGGEAAEELPPWSGVQAGSERLIGFLEFLAAFLDNPTKAPVTLPLGELLDLTARITLVTPPSPGAEDSIETNPGIRRDEKAELWSVLPDIHIAVLRLHLALIRRLRGNALPLAADILDQMVRVFNASRHLPAMHETAYTLAKEVLLLSGPTLPKLTVDSLTPLIQSTCQDILLATGYVEDNPPPASQPSTNGSTKPKPNPNATANTNADAYLASPNPSSFSALPFSDLQPTPATHLLPLLLSHLPQQHLAPELRALLDRTAVLARCKPALLASCLHPYRDGRGRYYPSLLPFLVRQFPRDQDVEVLRSNLVRAGAAAGRGGGGGGGEEEEEEAEELVEELGRHQVLRGPGREPGWGGHLAEDATEEVVMDGERKKGKEKVDSVVGPDMDMDVDVDDAPAANDSANPFATMVAAREEPAAEPMRPASPLKRRGEPLEDDAGKPPKRVDTGRAPQVAVMSEAAPAETKGEESEDESDSEESLGVELRDDEEDEEDEDEDEDEE
ncbi:uncharacterized protein THITE_71850 [Thermothielavioides terrestris NRRL 8126]|uniref:Pre-rRNA-processing protein RIX1 n=1 Tax=Thermothielavioides terrestris (strain ATCC 38088 / NRRL 8126) TaxID=578455 RepID=G2RC84_THETT|nr:uncharacterized protein THITE_71850 [Thermothielavioides terrestris NRRL 8126]AEO69405.1 hypothetical protein THITE_71850 [Thermothielavioides terrestris NRRL 8126]